MYARVLSSLVGMLHLIATARYLYPDIQLLEVTDLVRYKSRMPWKLLYHSCAAWLAAWLLRLPR